jgi:Raf kinase inhibitor-like YbhB/YbcL family protein
MNVIEENSNPGTQGINDFKRKGYGGPCPKSGVHHYLFKIYALDENLNLAEGLSKEELMSKMDGHIIDKAELSGSYSH